VSQSNQPEDSDRQQPDQRLHLSNLEDGAMATPDRAEAFLQELRAGAARLEQIISITGEIPRSNQPDRLAVATVPFITAPAVQWSRVTTGDSIGILFTLLQERGGLWLAKHLSALVEWTVGPAVGSPSTPGVKQAAAAQTTWIRADLQFVGAWNGRFAVATPVSRVASNLWSIALSPIIGFLPEEVAHKALPPANGGQPIDWNAFTRALDNVLHVHTQPSDAIRTLVRSADLPGAEHCR
jgi:hypothetical protein